ncbi:FkbM family methyltransferase [Roseomonas xinghualingensis]|uniref:FkbM family methyltransferase n=1 Tax=Roseomonas xinghualingensis TaxID=2986475 RepID=UPI0021F0D15D|nr:FkbM family methyltransferase [Roseomonas sp. SXEYE001]MCV4208927.1 FkbM family methyltransferase [Roseomonas sp. SXEYE001]
MQQASRPIAFVLAATNHGSMIVNRNDHHMVDQARGYGVGFQLLNRSSFDMEEVDFVKALLLFRRHHFGAGVVAIDCGANIGVHTVEWARLMHDWGRVIAFEAQEKIFYALAGNIALNNCLNVQARWAAVGASCGTINVPEPDYHLPSSYGSLELRRREQTEFIGQSIDYTAGTDTAVIPIDAFQLPRLDLIKIDVEGMEIDVLEGAADTIRRCRPQMVIEVIKSDRVAIGAILSGHGYRIYPMGLNLLAIHESDPTAGHITLHDGILSLKS